MRISDWSSDVCSSDLIGYQYARWSWNAGIDGMHSLSGNGFDGLYASGFLRYQASSTLGYGGSLNLRNAVDTSHSAQLFLDKQTAWGQTRVQVDQARDRKSVVWGKGVAVRVDLGGRRSIKKKKKKYKK